MVPLARWGETHDIGLAAVYLSSAAGGYVNAETLVVDGSRPTPPAAPTRLTPFSPWTRPRGRHVPTATLDLRLLFISQDRNTGVVKRTGSYLNTLK